MANRLFKACRDTDRGGGIGWARDGAKKQGRGLPPGPVHERGDHPFLGMQPLMPEPCSLGLAASAAALPPKAHHHL